MIWIQQVSATQLKWSQIHWKMTTKQRVRRILNIWHTLTTYLYDTAHRWNSSCRTACEYNVYKTNIHEPLIQYLNDCYTLNLSFGKIHIDRRQIISLLCSNLYGEYLLQFFW